MDDASFKRQLREAFHTEAEERLRALGQALLDLEAALRESMDPLAEPAERERLESAYRELHSLKGAARTVDLQDIELLCQHAETVLGLVKRGDLALTPPLFDVLQAVVGEVERLNTLALEGRAAAAGPVHSKLLSALKTLARGETPAPMTTASPAPEAQEPQEHTAENASSPTPSPPQAPPSAIPPEDALQEDRETASSPTNTPTPSPGVSPLRNHGHAPGEKAADDPPRRGIRERTPQRMKNIRLDAGDLDAMRVLAEELFAVRIAVDQRIQGLQDAVATLSGLRRLFLEARLEQQAQGGGTLRTATGQSGADDHEGATFALFLEACSRDLESLDDTLGSLALDLAKDGRALEHGVEDLGQVVNRAMLAPFKTITAAFPRIVRELAGQLGKEAVCEVVGDDVAIDRRILDMLRDPFTHLLRNAVGHGLEAPEKREALGKLRVGVVRVAVSRQGDGRVSVMVADDGRGLDREALQAKAAELGYLVEGEGGSEQALSLLFYSGVSTAPMVDAIAGRGLGMAIVREKIEQAGGFVEAASTPGEGTSFHISLPVALTTFDGVVVRAGGRRFVIPKDSLLRAARIPVMQQGDARGAPRGPRRPSGPDNFGGEVVLRAGGRECLQLEDGELAPLAHLAHILNVAGEAQTEDSGGVRNALVVATGGRVAAVEVDQVLEEREVMLKDLGSQLVRVRFVSGVTLLGDGSLAPVLHMGDVAMAALHPESAQRGAVRDEPGRPARVLVAEDSITSRMLLKNVLESAGYEVLTAVDGAEALAMVRADPPDLVVSDVEMPRLDGFGLTERLKTAPQTASLPVVLVTSLDAPEHRERGLDVGANAYIVKSRFDHANLLDVVSSLL